MMQNVYNNNFEGWIVDLSDGTQRFEQPPVEGEKTSWQKLLDHLEEKDLFITGLRLKHFGITIQALPHKQCDGYIQVYETRKKFFRGTGPNPERSELLHGIGSIVDDVVYITWINLNTGAITQDVRSLASSRVHTTLRRGKEAVNVQRQRHKQSTKDS